jgi:ADP-heptose:LPS heptosyltransferase
MSSSRPVQKIGIFRALYLGDMLCIIPVVRALRAHYPDASITLIGLAWQRDLVKRFDRHFNHFIEFSGWPGLPEQQFTPKGAVAFLEQMQQQCFDIVLQMQGNGVLTNTMCLLWNGAVTCGLRTEGAYCPDENLFPVSSDQDHEVKRFMKLLDALNVPQQGTHLEFPLLEEEQVLYHSIARKLSLPAHEYVCIHPGSRDPKRRWSPANFALIADQLTQLGYTVVLTGSAQEDSIIREVEAKMKYNAVNAVASFNEITLGVLGAIIKYAKLLISNDTGVSHMASAFSTPSVIIFSRYSPISRWAPENGERHRIITHDKSKDVRHVWRYVQQQLNYSPATHAAFQ